jgi:antitoxin PrlF
VPLVLSGRRRTTTSFSVTDELMHLRKEFLHSMSTDDPEVTTVTSKGQITIPSRLREQFGIEKGTKLMVVPTEYGLVLKKIDLPSVEEFRKRVEARAEETDLSMDEVDQLVHDARGSDE